MDQLSYGVVVLSARRTVTLPVLSSSKMYDHIPGSVFHGRAGGLSPNTSHVSIPSRGVDCHLYSGGHRLTEQMLRSVGEGVGLRDHTNEEKDLRSTFKGLASGASLPGEYIALEQVLPFGVLGLHSNESGLRLFGFYSSACDLLVWTNTPDPELLLEGTAKNEWGIYRFKERPVFTCLIFTRRVCQRWHRWSSSLASSDLKFQALERSIFLGGD